MKRQWLHDLSKFGAGLVAADFLMLWWIGSHGYVPQMFLGLSSSLSSTAMIVDVFLFLMLVHYGWNIGKMPQMKERMYLVVAGAIFTVVAAGHLLRLATSADVTVLGWDVPVFLSWIGVAIATYLAYASFHFAARIGAKK
jgi:hypothetical protein